VFRLPGSPPPTTSPLPSSLWHLPSAWWASRSHGSGLRQSIPRAKPDGRLRLARQQGRIEFVFLRIARSPRGCFPRRLAVDAVTSGYRTVGSPGVDFHLPDKTHSWTHDGRPSPAMTVRSGCAFASDSVISQRALSVGSRREAGEATAQKQVSGPPARDPERYVRAPIGRSHAFTGNLDPFVGSVLPTRPILCKFTEKDFVIAGGIDPVLGRPTVAFRTTWCPIALSQGPDDIPIRRHQGPV
jgi:hypothetical protein